MNDNITVSRELLRQVLEVLKKGDTYFISPAGDLTKPTIAALRAALEQAPVQEPPGRCPSCMTYNGHQDGCPTTPQPAPAERTVQEPSCKWPSCQTEQYQNDLADHIAKELIGEQPRKAVLDWMSPDEVRAAVRFCETRDDDEGYDVPRTMMKRLEALGLVVDKKFGRFEQTSLLLDIREALEAEKERGWTDEPLYSETQVKELLAQADKDFSDGMTVVHLQVADQMKKRYEPVLKQALEALWTTATPKCEDAIKAIQEVLA